MNDEKRRWVAVSTHHEWQGKSVEQCQKFYLDFPEPVRVEVAEYYFDRNLRSTPFRVMRSVEVV